RRRQRPRRQAQLRRPLRTGLGQRAGQRQDPVARHQRHVPRADPAAHARLARARADRVRPGGARLMSTTVTGGAKLKVVRGKDQPAPDKRYLALRNFAISISVFNVFGYTLLGFEQPWIWPIIAVLTGYTTEFAFETLSAWATGKPARYRGNGARGV